MVVDKAPKSQETMKTITDLKMVCKNCKTDTSVIPKYAKYGYYFECNDCNTNTTMKYTCPQCESNKTKVSKKKTVYSLNCGECDFFGEIKYN
jgi:transcription elongation factor Elf1